MTTNTRLSDLLSAIPSGSFYLSNGRIIPYRNTPTSLRLISDYPITKFLILVNGVQSGYVTTDVNGNAIFEAQLPLGDVVLELQQENSTNKVISYVTTRNYSTWLAAYAEQIERIDDYTENTLDSFYLARSGAEDINLAHGVPLIYPNNSSCELEAYREMLQLVRQATRQFAGRWSGKAGIIAALTQVNPLILYRQNNGSRWILGHDLLPNGDLQDITRYIYAPTALANINASGQFIKLDVGNTLGISYEYLWDTNYTLYYNPYFNSLVLYTTKWEKPYHSGIPAIDADGEYVVYAGTPASSLKSLEIVPDTILSDGIGRWPMTPGLYDHLYVELDKLGVADVWMWLNLGGGLGLHHIVRAFAKASVTYGARRSIVSISVPGFIEIIHISNNTGPNLLCSITITGVGPYNITYTGPVGGAGPSRVVVLNSEMTLMSGNGIDYIVINVGNTVVAGFYQFYAEYTYKFCSTIQNDHLLLHTGNSHTELGNPNEVIVHDGPANIATLPFSTYGGLFDAPKIRTSLLIAASTGNTQIGVPPGTAPSFSSADGVAVAPFDITVGHGFKNTAINSFTITPDVGNQTAIMNITSGGIFEAGDQFVSLLINGTAPTFSQVTGTLSFITINTTTANTPAGIGNLYVQNISGSYYLQYMAPGDAWGAQVLLSGLGGTTNVYSNDTLLFINITYTVALVAGLDKFYVYSAADERNTGVHKIIDILTTTSARISYHGLNTSKIQPIQCSYIISVDPSCLFGSASIDYQLSGGFHQFRWKEPGDSYGSWVIFQGLIKTFPLYSNNGKYIMLLFDDSNPPASSPITTTFTIGKFVSYTSQAADTARIWSNGEIAKVVQVDATSPEIWHLENPIIGNYDVGMTVYPTTLLPLVDAKIPTGQFAVEINQAFAPAIMASDSVQAIGGTGYGLSDGWVETTGSSAYVSQTTDAKFSKSAMAVIPPSITEVILEHVVPVTGQMFGLIHTFKVWIQNISVNIPSISVYLGFNFGSSWIESPASIISDPNDTVRQSQLISFAQVIPPNTTDMKVRIRVPTVSLERFILDRAVLENNFIALFLGHNTTPRSQGRAGFGSLLYVWGSDELTTTEINDLGIPNIVYPSGRGGVAYGRIREAHNAHETADIFDITDVVSSSVVNVRGCVTDVEWITALLTNLEVVSRIPTRFSYVRPTVINSIAETLNVDPSGPYIAALSTVSDQNQQKAFIYANDIPLLVTEWQFNSSTEVEILSGFNPDITYSIEYNALIQLETAPIDIISPSDNGNDTWFADYVVWNRQVSNISTLRTVVSLVFGPDFVAQLPRRSDQDKLSSVLVANTGVIKRIIPAIAWEYIESSTVRINSAEFSPNAIYTLEYNQRFVSPDRATNVLAEIRSAASVFSLSTTPYVTFDPHINSAVDGSLRYHQIRMTINGVADVRDVRIHSAVVKGMRLNTSPIVPGL